MEPEAFVTELANTAPSMVDLEKCGLSSDEAARFRRYYFCTKPDRPSQQPTGIDPVLELLRNWDLSTVEIGMVRFPKPPVERSGKVLIGLVEADPLVLLAPGGEVVVHELGTEHLLWRVAKDGSGLLDALIMAARFLSMVAVSDLNSDHNDAARSMASQCAFAAGGNRYLDFYTMLFGAE